MARLRAMATSQVIGLATLSSKRAAFRHREIDLLQHVLCLAPIVQDTQADAKKLRRGGGVDKTQGVAIAGRYPGDRCGELPAPRLRVHVYSESVSGPYCNHKDTPILADAGRTALPRPLIANFAVAN